MSILSRILRSLIKLALFFVIIALLGLNITGGGVTELGTMIIVTFNIIFKILGFAAVYLICASLHLPGLLTVILSLGGIVGMAYLSSALASMILSLVSGAFAVVVLVAILGCALFGGIGMLIMGLGLTEEGLSGEERGTIIEIGSRWKDL